MKDDNNKYMLSMFAILASIGLALIYTQIPINDNSNLWLKLAIECIPNLLAALIAIPTVYWLFYRRGLVTMGDCPLAANHGKANDFVQTNSREHYMQQIPEEISKAASTEPKPDGQYDVLIVVDVQNDFITGSFKAHNAINIIDNLNTVIHIAENKNMLIVFTKDWHPSNHHSFEADEENPNNSGLIQNIA